MRIMNKIRTTVGLLALLVAAQPTRQVHAATLDGNTSLNTDSVQIPLQNGTQNVLFKATAPFGAATGGYLFGDRLADGNNVAVTPPGLSLGPFSLYHNPNSISVQSRPIRLNLNGGDLTATVGCLNTTNTGHTGSIAIYNVANIAMGNGYISTMRHTYTGGSRNAASIEIGQNGINGPRAGNIQVASLDASIRNGNGIGGAIALYGTGDVAITNSSGVAGDIFTGKHPLNTTGGEARPIVIAHNGTLRAGTISNQRVGATSLDDRHNVSLDGGVLGGMHTGQALLNTIDTRAYLSSGATNSRRLHSGHAGVCNYASVTIDGNIFTSTMTYHAGFLNIGAAGDIAITNIVSDITVGGDIDAGSNASGNPVTSRGILTMQCGGAISLASLDMSKVNHARLAAAGGATIAGELLNFDTAGGGAGSEADPVLTTQTALRAPSGQAIFYDPEANPSLEGKVYRVADLAGTAAQGGLLMPKKSTSGTVIVVR